MIDLMREIEEFNEKEVGYFGRLATKHETCSPANSHKWLPDYYQQPQQPLAAKSKLPRSGDSSQLAILAKAEVNDLLYSICTEYSVTKDWLEQIVICQQDIDDLQNGDLPISCLRAHIEYHLGRQREWNEFKKGINHISTTVK
jgi:hypothetical protein